MHLCPAIGMCCVGLIVAGVGCAGNSSSATGTTQTNAATGGGSTATGTAGTSSSSGMTGSAGSKAGTGGATAGAGGSGGVGGSGGAGGAGDGGPNPGAARPPVPPGPGNVPPPSGSTANLKVVPWAGFRGAVTYTFDDSQPSQIDHFADIQAAGVPVTYYITTVNNWYAGYDATWKEAFARGNELGNHTVNHCYANLTCPSGMALPTLAAEIDQATDYITTRLGSPDVYTMAYPFGDTDYRAAAQARFFLGRVAGPGSTNGMVAPSDATDPFLLPVIAAAGGEAATKFSGDIDAARTQGKWVTFLFHSLLPDAQNWFAGVDIATVTGSIAHAKALSDMWIDTFANVGAYWLGQKTLQAATSTSAAGSTTWTWSLPSHFPPGKILRVTVDGGTLKQNMTTLVWDGHGYYEILLDTGTLTWSP